MRSMSGAYGVQAWLYNDEYRAATVDVDFWLDQLRAERVAGRVLDLGTGTGRIALPLARAGYDVTGIDLSDAMLAVAWRVRQREPAEVARRLHFRRSDMRTMAFREPFAAILAPFSVFGCLPSAADREACLRRCRRLLPPGGLLIIDALAPTPTAGAAGRRRLFVSRFRLARGGHSVVKRTYESVAAGAAFMRMAYHYRVFHVTDAHLLASVHVRFRLARLTAADLSAALEGAGFVVEQVLGDYRGRPYGPTSPRLIVQARRA